MVSTGANFNGPSFVPIPPLPQAAAPAPVETKRSTPTKETKSETGPTQTEKLDGFTKAEENVEQVVQRQRQDVAEKYNTANAGKLAKTLNDSPIAGNLAQAAVGTKTDEDKKAEDKKRSGGLEEGEEESGTLSTGTKSTTGAGTAPGPKKLDSLTVEKKRKKEEDRLADTKIRNLFHSTKGTPEAKAEDKAKACDMATRLATNAYKNNDSEGLTKWAGMLEEMRNGTLARSEIGLASKGSVPFLTAKGMIRASDSAQYETERAEQYGGDGKFASFLRNLNSQELKAPPEPAYTSRAPSTTEKATAIASVLALAGSAPWDSKKVA